MDSRHAWRLFGANINHLDRQEAANVSGGSRISEKGRQSLNVVYECQSHKAWVESLGVLPQINFFFFLIQVLNMCFPDIAAQTFPDIAAQTNMDAY